VWLRLLAVVALVGANAFFVATEFALVSARRTRIRELVDAGDRRARQVAHAQADLDRAISGTQLGITLATLGRGWICEPAVVRTIEPAITAIGLGSSPLAIHSVAVAISFLFLTYLHIVLGELAPKTVALLRPETTSRYVAGPLIAFNRVLGPGIWLLNGSSALVLRLLRLSTPGSGIGRVHSPDEIEMLVQQSHKEGVVEEDEQAMIQGVFELTRTVAREVMTPRPDIVAVATTATIADVLRVAAESGFSRLPVHGESLDEIVGIVVLKDVLGALVADTGADGSAGTLMREPLFVPDTKPVDDLLAELRSRKTHMAVVVDEFGGTDGIVTLEDVLEEIVGEIYDEHDEEEEAGILHAEDRIVVDGGYSFSDFLIRFDLGRSVDAEEFDTVAGFVIGRLGRIPEEGDTVPIGDAELQVLERNERRVTKLELLGVAWPGVDAPSDVDANRG
jgi:CBS domain containing-hemolysin-like protein